MHLQLGENTPCNNSDLVTSWCAQLSMVGLAISRTWSTDYDQEEWHAGEKPFLIPLSAVMIGDRELQGFSGISINYPVSYYTFTHTMSAEGDTC